MPQEIPTRNFRLDLQFYDCELESQQYVQLYPSVFLLKKEDLLCRAKLWYPKNWYQIILEKGKGESHRHTETQTETHINTHAISRSQPQPSIHICIADERENVPFLDKKAWRYSDQKTFPTVHSTTTRGEHTSGRYFWEYGIWDQFNPTIDFRHRPLFRKNIYSIFNKTD